MGIPMKPAIRVEELSKQYQLGAGSGGPYRTLRESLNQSVSKVWQRWRRREPRPAPGDTLWALNDVSFDIEPGEVVGIIGRNGAGKSTLLKVLSRITEPSTGRVELRGSIGSLLEVGTGFHPELTGRENVFLNGAILGMPRREIARRFDEIVAFAEVERFLDTPVKRYSSGMYVRLAFAVAAHLEPEILVVDEVLAVGDAAFQQKCLAKMGDVARGGRTVLLVSHTMSAIQQLCTRALLMRGGQLAADGPTEKVVANYLSDASASSGGQFDLADHPARPAAYRPLIQGLTLFGPDGQPTTHYHPEDPLEAELLIVPEAPIREPRVALAIEDALGRRIMTAASYFESPALADITGPCRVRCKLPKLQLGSGRYLVSVSIATRYTGLLDSLDAAVWFEVVWNNNYGTGEPYLPVYGPVLTSSSWRQDA